MNSFEYWEKLGFRFDTRYPTEYELWINPNTLQYLRFYVNGQVWLQDLATGKYELAENNWDGN